MIHTSEWRFATPQERQNLVLTMRDIYDREETARHLGCTTANVYYHETKRLKRRYH